MTDPREPASPLPPYGPTDQFGPAAGTSEPPPVPPVPPAPPGPAAAPQPNLAPASTPVPAPRYPSESYQGTRKYNTLAIVGFVLAFFTAIGGIICGHLALSQIKRTGEAGHGLAVAATVLGYVFTGLTLIYIAFMILLVVGLATAGTMSTDY